MSSGHKLSKRSSMWESIYNLPNYTRPQGWATIDHSQKIEETGDLAEAAQSICIDRYSIELEPAALEDLEKYLKKQSVNYPLTYNRLIRLIGQWLVSEFSPSQEEYGEGYQSLSF